MKVRHIITPETWTNRGSITAVAIEVSTELQDRILFHMDAIMGTTSKEVKFSMGKKELQEILNYK